MNGTWPPASSRPPGVSSPTCKRTTVPSLLVFGNRLKRKLRTETLPLVTPKTVGPVTADIMMLVDGELGGLDLDVDVVAGVSLDGRRCQYLCFGILFAAHLSLCSSMETLQQHHRTPALWTIAARIGRQLEARTLSIRKGATCQGYARPMHSRESSLHQGHRPSFEHRKCDIVSVFAEKCFEVLRYGGVVRQHRLMLDIGQMSNRRKYASKQA